MVVGRAAVGVPDRGVAVLPVADVADVGMGGEAGAKYSLGCMLTWFVGNIPNLGGADGSTQEKTYPRYQPNLICE